MLYKLITELTTESTKDPTLKGTKPGRETKERPGFKRTNYGKKPGRETKLNDQDLKERTMDKTRSEPDLDQIRIRFKWIQTRFRSN
ncbi:unnamed protein product [Rhizophagus irregularis]|nr:unnamed protein product [Rhizophagus irregularis]